MSTWRANDQTKYGQDEDGKLAQDIEEANDQNHSSDFRLGFQTLSDDLGVKCKFFGFLQTDFSIDDTDEKDPQNNTNDPWTQQRHDSRDEFHNVQSVGLGIVIVVRNYRQNAKYAYDCQGSSFILTGTVHLRIEWFDNNHQTKTSDGHN